MNQWSMLPELISLGQRTARLRMVEERINALDAERMHLKRTERELQEGIRSDKRQIGKLTREQHDDIRFHLGEFDELLDKITA